MIIILLLVVAIIIALIYLYVYVFKKIAELYTSTLEIKSKIGSLIREINNNNQLEYSTDYEQQKSIDNLNYKVAQEISKSK